jgi:hypothetical protein
MPSTALAASGMITCAVDPFDADGATGKQQLTVTFDGTQATLQSPWGSIVYDDAIVTGDDEHLAVIVGGEKPVMLPDFAGMEACLAKAPAEALHRFATLLTLVAECGHSLPFAAGEVAAQTLFTFAAEGSSAMVSMSLSYSEDSSVANDYLEFRQKRACRRLM